LPADFLSPKLKHLKLIGTPIEDNPKGDKIGLNQIRDHFQNFSKILIFYIEDNITVDRIFKSNLINKVYETLKREDLHWNFKELRELTNDSVPNHQFGVCDYIAILKAMKEDIFIEENTFMLLEYYIRKLFNLDNDCSLPLLIGKDTTQINFAKNLLEYILKTLKSEYSQKKAFHENQLKNDSNYKYPKDIYEDCFPSVLSDISLTMKNQYYVAQCDILVDSYRKLYNHNMQKILAKIFAVDNKLTPDEEYECFIIFIKLRLQEIKESKFAQLGNVLCNISDSTATVLVLNRWRDLMKNEIGLVNIINDTLYLDIAMRNDPFGNSPQEILLNFYKSFTIQEICNMLRDELNQDGVVTIQLRNRLAAIISFDAALSDSEKGSMCQRVNENDTSCPVFNLITEKAIEYLLIKLKLVIARNDSIQN
jgi:hypothetical protein